MNSLDYIKLCHSSVFTSEVAVVSNLFVRRFEVLIYCKLNTVLLL